MGQTVTEAVEQKDADAAKAASEASASAADERLEAALKAMAETSAKAEAAITASGEQAAAAAEREQAALERAAAAEAELAEVRALAEAGGGDGENAVLARLTDVVEALAAQGPAGKTFAAGESAEDVMQSLEGTTVPKGEYGFAMPGDDILPAHEAVTFIAKGTNHFVVRKGRVRVMGPNGEATVSTGCLLDFSPSGMLTTRSVQNIAHLRARPGFNQHFWEQGAEPNQAPSPAPIIRKIAKATAEFDVEQLHKLRADEVATANRGDILTMIDSSVDAITNPED